MAWSREALLLAADQTSQTQLHNLAKSLNYQAITVPEKPAHQEKPSNTTEASIVDRNRVENKSQAFPKMLFWQITKIINLKQPEAKKYEFLLDQQLAAQHDPNAAGTLVFEPPAPLVSLRQLTPLLINSLGRNKTTGKLNSRKLIKKISQAQPIKQLDYQQQRKWPLQITVLVDKHQELYPYWSDFDHIVKQLKIQLGPNHVQLLTLHERNLQRMIPQLADIHSSVLILSDLNDYANNHRYCAWYEILNLVQQQAQQILTLSPAAISTWSGQAYKKLRITSLAPQQGNKRHANNQGINLTVNQDDIEWALAMISPLPLVDQGLLRKLRTRFGWGSAAIEGVIWNDDRLVQSYIGLRLQASEQKKYRHQFNQLATDQKENYWELVENHHKPAYPGLKNLERINKSQIGLTTGSEQTPALNYLKSLLAYYQQSADPTKRSQILAQITSMLSFVSETIWAADSELAEIMYLCYALKQENEQSENSSQQNLCAEFQLNKVPEIDLTSKPESYQRYSLELYNAQGTAKIVQNSKKASTVLEFSSNRIHPALLQQGPDAEHRLLTPEHIMKLEENQELIIKSAQKHWHILAIKKPEFAQNIGQDHLGLFIDTQTNGLKQRYYWFPEQGHEDSELLAGAWFPEKLLSEVIKQPEFVQNIGQDEEGIFMDTETDGYKQRYYWFPEQDREQTAKLSGDWFPQKPSDKTIKQPGFAQNIGQDQEGIFIDKETDGHKQRYYWFPKEDYIRTAKITGAWFPKKPLPRTIERDVYGFFKDIKIKNIQLRFRYIQPGVFLMGSPENEPGRFSNETQHTVTLSQGYWLADRCVTQQLYQAVMGENPSRFKGKIRPVEKVSWDDAQAFIQLLKKIQPELSFQLPTEAQWEYACRAGTETAFSFADEITLQKVNYRGTWDDYENWGESAKKETTAVKAYPANPWGLYDMHGNVWEWCEDEYQQDLGKEPVMNPLETGAGIPRVVRGGSWNSGGRGLRSAMRSWFQPDNRCNIDLGFRLSLGLLSSSQEQVGSYQSQSRRDVAI